MSHPASSRPDLSDENTGNLNRAILLSDSLQGPVLDPGSKLSELRVLLNRCRKGIVDQNPRFRRQRMTALNQARNYLHFLMDMGQDDARGRLQSVSRRLRTAARER